MDRNKILDDLEDLQLKVDEMNFKGSNERDLFLREETADYIERTYSSIFVKGWEARVRQLKDNGWLVDDFDTYGSGYSSDELQKYSK